MTGDTHLQPEPQEERGAPGSRGPGSDEPAGGPADRPAGTSSEDPGTTRGEDVGDRASEDRDYGYDELGAGD